MNNKNMKLLGIMFVVVLMIGLVFADNVCPDCPRSAEGGFGDGVYQDIGGGIHETEDDCTAANGGNPCIIPEGKDLASNPEAAKYQETMTKEQAKSYNEELLNQAGIENFDGNTEDIIWSKDLKSLKYRGAEMKVTDLQEVSGKMVEFGDHYILAQNGDGKIFKWDDTRFELFNPENLGGTSNPVGAAAANIPAGCSTCPTAGGTAGAISAQAGGALGSAFGPLGQAMGGALGGAAGAGGQGLGIWDQAAQFGVQMAQTVAGLVPKQEDEVPNPIDNSGPNAGPTFAETYFASLRGDAELTQEGVTISNNAIGTFGSGGQTSLVVGQTNPSTKSTIQEGGDNSINVNNLVAARPNEAVVSTPSGQETNINLNGIAGSTPNFPVSSTSSTASLKPGFLNKLKDLFPLNSLITGKAISVTGQSVDFTEHDLTVNGNNIGIYALKTFEDVEFAGNDLDFYTGNIHMSFNGQRIMYSRLVNNAPYGIKRVSNKLDINQNRYTLQHYEDHMGELYDENHIIYVGDVTSQVGKGPYSRLLISRDRLEMFS